MFTSAREKHLILIDISTILPKIDPGGSDKNTKSGPAKFKPEVHIESVDRDVWENGTPTTNGQNWKVKEFNNVQGAYKGKETKWVVTKESQGTIHSHPIGSNEAVKLTK